jgi:hypothetical protein
MQELSAVEELMVVPILIGKQPTVDSPLLRNTHVRNSAKPAPRRIAAAESPMSLSIPFSISVGCGPEGPLPKRDGAPSKRRFERLHGKKEPARPLPRAPRMIYEAFTLSAGTARILAMLDSTCI